MSAEELGADGKRSRYNAAVLIQKDGQPGGALQQDAPRSFRRVRAAARILPWMDQFSPYDFDYSIRPGEEFTRFRLKDYRFGVIICYEDTDPPLARQYVRPGNEQPARLPRQHLQ